MSDLDTDLYGGMSNIHVLLRVLTNPISFVDLYGNDDNEFAVPTESQEDVVSKAEPEEAPVTEKAAPPPSKPAEPATPEPKISTPATQHAIKHEPSPPAENSTSSIPSYTSPPTQQIPTYQERQDTDYSQMSNMPDGAFQGAINADRPVRPSEMKEEG